MAHVASHSLYAARAAAAFALPRCYMPRQPYARFTALLLRAASLRFMPRALCLLLLRARALLRGFCRAYAPRFCRLISRAMLLTALPRRADALPSCHAVND